MGHVSSTSIHGNATSSLNPSSAVPIRPQDSVIQRISSLIWKVFKIINYESVIFSLVTIRIVQTYCTDRKKVWLAALTIFISLFLYKKIESISNEQKTKEVLSLYDLYKDRKKYFDEVKFLKNVENCETCDALIQWTNEIIGFIDELMERKENLKLKNVKPYYDKKGEKSCSFISDVKEDLSRYKQSLEEIKQKFNQDVFSYRKKSILQATQRLDGMLIRRIQHYQGWYEKLVKKDDN